MGERGKVQVKVRTHSLNRGNPVVVQMKARIFWIDTTSSKPIKYKNERNVLKSIR